MLLMLLLMLMMVLITPAAPCPLSLHFSLLSVCRLVYLDHVSHPDMPVALAVHASSAIPFFYQPVLYEGKLYVDGGAIRNLPWDGFEKDENHTMLALVLRTGGMWPVEINLLYFSSRICSRTMNGGRGTPSLLFSRGG